MTRQMLNRFDRAQHEMVKAAMPMTPTDEPTLPDIDLESLLRRMTIRQQLEVAQDRRAA